MDSLCSVILHLGKEKPQRSPNPTGPMYDNHSLLCLGAMFPVSHHWRYFSNSELTPVSLYAAQGNVGPILQALTGYPSSSRGKIDKSPDSGSLPGDQSAFTTLLNTFVRVYPLPVGPDGIMEPTSQGSWGLGENAQVLTTVPGTNVTLYPATLWETRPALPKSWSQRTQAATCPGWTQDRKYCLILRLDEIIATWKTSGCNK